MKHRCVHTILLILIFISKNIFFIYLFIYLFFFTYIYKQSKQSRSVMSDSLRPPRAVAYQSPLSMGFSRQEYWSGLPFPSPGDLPDPGIEPRSPTLQADTLPSEPPMVHVQTDEKGVVGILCICFQGGVTTHTTQHVWAWSCILSFSWSLILLSFVLFSP